LIECAQFLNFFILFYSMHPLLIELIFQSKIKFLF